MRQLVILALVLGSGAPAVAQGAGPMQGWGHGWGMGGGMGWGGGMILGPLLTIGLVILLIVLIAPYVRSFGGGGAGPRTPTARDVLDERYAKGEIDREEYLRRRQDIGGE
jgi:putative membrane protein